MRADLDRRIPIVPQVFLIGFRLWADVDGFTCSAIEAADVALLRLAIDDVRILGIDRGIVPVAANRNPPIRIADAGVIASSRRSILGIVVLGPAGYMVERLLVGNGDLVKLRERQIGEELIVLGVVVGTIQATVATDEQEIWIGRMEGDGVIVHMLVVVAYALPCCAAVSRAAEHDVGMVNHVEAMRIAV